MLFFDIILWLRCFLIANKLSFVEKMEDSASISLFATFEKELENNVKTVRGKSRSMELELIKTENKKIQLEADILNFSWTILKSATSFLQSIQTNEEDAERSGMPIENDIVGKILLSILDLSVDQITDEKEVEPAKTPPKKKRKMDENSNFIQTSKSETFKSPLTRSSLRKAR